MRCILFDLDWTSALELYKAAQVDSISAIRMLEETRPDRCALLPNPLSDRTSFIASKSRNPWQMDTRHRSKEVMVKSGITNTPYHINDQMKILLRECIIKRIAVDDRCVLLQAAESGRSH